MNWLLIVVGCILLIGLIAGIARGAVKIIVSLLATVVTLVIVFFATPYVDDIITRFVPIEEIVSTRVEDIIMGGIYTQTSDESALSGDAEAIKNALNAAGVTQEQLDSLGITDEDIAAGNITSDQLSQLGVSSGILEGVQGTEDTDEEESAGDSVGELSRETQNLVIDESYIPDIFKKLLKTNNNNEIYEKLGVDNFVSYASAYLGRAIVNVVAFLLTFIVVTIVLRAILFALNIITDLPGVGAVNRVCGGILGIGSALVIVWFLFTVITLMFTTGVGRELMDMIEENTLLKLIYAYNPILKVATIFKL